MNVCGRNGKLEYIGKMREKNSNKEYQVAMEAAVTFLKRGPSGPHKEGGL